MKYTIPKGAYYTRVKQVTKLEEQYMHADREVTYTDADIIQQDALTITFKLPESAAPWKHLVVIKREMEISE